MYSSKGIWITWELHRRSQGLASALDWPLYEFHVEGPRAVRYLKCLTGTVRAIRAERPKLVIVQNPSIVLTAVSIVLKPLFGYRVAVDAHNSGIYPLEGKSQLLMAVSRWIQRKADYVIVTNRGLKRVIKSNGGNALVLPDRLPTPAPATVSAELDGEFNIVYICTFSEDEPFREVLEAADKISPNITIYFTGKYNGKVDTDRLPHNVRLLGFVPDEEYWALLGASDVVMDLTLRENCLVCGAYEGVSLRKPLILSDTEALRSYFSSGCVYVSPSAASIARGITTAIENIQILKEQASRLRNKLEREWQEKFEEVKSRIYELAEESS